MKSFRKYGCMLIILALFLSLLGGCAADPTSNDLPFAPKPPSPLAGKDGEITGDSNGIEAPGATSKGDMAMDAMDAVAPDEEAEYDAPAGDDSYCYEEAKPMAPGADVSYADGGFTQQAGQLTASEWNDLGSWEDFTALVNENRFYSIAQKWSTFATSRVKVSVTCGGAAVKGARVELLDANGTVLFVAVTNYEGVAYTFCNVTSEQKTQQPHSVRVTSVNGKSAQALLDGKQEISVEVSEATNPTPTLDLMFVVDTTGSMGDELEYLKAELGDVITRAAQASSIDVRTSVNFYRDTTDQYVVRYYDFRDSVDEVVTLLGEQRAMGGGDYPEAVHTALANAVNDHAWAKDSVKLLFFVFDAPPHDQADVMASLHDSILRAASMGIRIIPVASSGVDDTCQLLFRSYAALTGGTYTYLTNHSGIGGSHATPDLPEEPGVERLNDLIVRLITEYCQ